MRDYYEILGVHRKATPKEIKAAFRQIARENHPDVTGDDPQATALFKEATEAYECLSDEKQRRTYDLFGHPDDNGLPGFSMPGFENLGFVSDIIADFVGKGADPTAKEPGVDMEIALDITFDEAFLGCEKTIDTHLRRPCSDCEGKGAPKDATWSECKSCEGSGKKTKIGPIPFGRGCTTCRARGEVPSQKCRGCHGTGARDEKGKVRVRVPAGARDGSKLRLKGRGAAGANGGAPGDLYVKLTVAADDLHERDGDDLLSQVRVGLFDALYGCEQEVKLPGGKTRFKVPPGTQGGQTFRLRGKGFVKGSQKDRGDAYVTVQVRLPKEIGGEDKALFDALRERNPNW